MFKIHYLAGINNKIHNLRRLESEAKMTRKFFRAVAQCVKNLDVDEKTRLTVANALAETLIEYNSGFRKQTFVDACGVKG